jgi:hypothetical protein
MRREMDNSQERLLTYLRKYVGKVSIDEQTRIYHDLHISGDDALQLIDHLRENFGVDFSTMNFSEYFPGESEAFLEHLGRFFGVRAKRKSLTFGHLSQVVQKRYWHEPGAIGRTTARF